MNDGDPFLGSFFVAEFICMFFKVIRDFDSFIRIFDSFIRIFLFDIRI